MSVDILQGEIHEMRFRVNADGVSMGHEEASDSSQLSSVLFKYKTMPDSAET